MFPSQASAFPNMALLASDLHPSVGFGMVVPKTFRKRWLRDTPTPTLWRYPLSRDPEAYLGLATTAPQWPYFLPCSLQLGPELETSSEFFRARLHHRHMAIRLDWRHDGIPWRQMAAILFVEKVGLMDAFHGCNRYWSSLSSSTSNSIEADFSQLFPSS